MTRQLRGKSMNHSEWLALIGSTGRYDTEGEIEMTKGPRETTVKSRGVADTAAGRYAADLTERLGWAAERVDADALRHVASHRTCGGQRPVLLAVALPLDQLEALLLAAENPRKPRLNWRRRVAREHDHHSPHECLEKPGTGCGRTCESCPSRTPALRQAARDLREAVEIRRAMDLNAWGASGSPLR